MGERGRERAQQTNVRFELRTVAEVRRIPPYEVRKPDGSMRTVTPTGWEIVGDCGHVLDTVTAGIAAVERRWIEEGRARRKRCVGCPRKTGAPASDPGQGQERA
jgi:hypothetical protein